MTGTRILVVLFALVLPAMRAGAEVVISAAVSLSGTLDKVRPLLETAAGEKITFNFGASGTLAGQIQQGAPVDLFISADRPTVERLVTAKAAAGDSLKVIAGNTLVLIEPRGSTAGLTGFADLLKIKRLAIGEPKVVPAGTYARETLVALKLWEPLERAGKLVTCENVAQVVMLVDRGEAEAGIAYRTDVATAKNVRIVTAADPLLHSKIEYVSAIISASHNKAGAQKVQGALAMEKVVAVLKEAGFTAPGP